MCLCARRNKQENVMLERSKWCCTDGHSCRVCGTKWISCSLSFAESWRPWKDILVVLVNEFLTLYAQFSESRPLDTRAFLPVVIGFFCLDRILKWFGFGRSHHNVTLPTNLSFLSTDNSFRPNLNLWYCAVRFAWQWSIEWLNELWLLLNIRRIYFYFELNRIFADQIELIEIYSCWRKVVLS